MVTEGSSAKPLPLGPSGIKCAPPLGWVHVPPYSNDNSRLNPAKANIQVQSHIVNQCVIGNIARYTSLLLCPASC